MGGSEHLIVGFFKNTFYEQIESPFLVDIFLYGLFITTYVLV